MNNAAPGVFVYRATDIIDLIIMIGKILFMHHMWPQWATVYLQEATNFLRSRGSRVRRSPKCMLSPLKPHRHPANIWQPSRLSL